jgi:hypothetical protein
VKPSKPPLLISSILTIALAAGCASPSSPLSVSPDAESGGEAGAAGAGATAACLAVTAPMAQGPTTFTCALPQPCDVVVYHGLDGPGGYPPAATIDLPAAQCVLQHLRDAVSAHLTMNHPNTEGYDDTDLWVQRDGSVIYERHWRLDLGGEDYGPRRFRVKPKAFFDACLLETDPKMVYDCLTSWWVDGACSPVGDLPCAP